MKHKNILFILILLLALISACDKYKDVDPSDRIKGYVRLHDELGIQFPVPLTGKIVKLNSGTDIDNYILQTTTDSAGYFSLDYIRDDTSVIYVRFANGLTEYFGKKEITADNKDSIQQIEVYPSYYNGVSILFEDIYKKPISNLSFRLYTSYLYALADSTKHAYLNSTSTNVGLFTQYNMPANTYYIVANDSVRGGDITVFDSLIVEAKGIFKKTVSVK